MEALSMNYIPRSERVYLEKFRCPVCRQYCFLNMEGKLYDATYEIEDLYLSMVHNTCLPAFKAGVAKDNINFK